MRLIDAESLKELFPDNGEGSWTYNATVKAYIDAQPTVQPDIIHCKDCEYLCNEDGLRGMCWHINGFGTDIKDKYNSFCSWAERREVTE